MASENKPVKQEVDVYDAEKAKNYKLIVDPQIKRGQEKLVRFDGCIFSSKNHGQGVVVLRDPRPRMNRLWSRREKAELPVPRYKVDEWYIGAVPPREVTFSKLNDNITKHFMEKMCIKFGKLERVRVYHHPKTDKHMGLSKIVFSSIKAAAECVSSLHMTSVMGNVVHAQIDCKGEILNKLYHKIIKGEMIAETIPDVIRHTQDGITMSNKYKHCNHHQSGNRDKRKMSHDDPRKQRKSSDSSEKHKSHSHRKQSGPSTPPNLPEDVNENKIVDNSRDASGSGDNLPHARLEDDAQSARFKNDQIVESLGKNRDYELNESHLSTKIIKDEAEFRVDEWPGSSDARTGFEYREDVNFRKEKSSRNNEQFNDTNTGSISPVFTDSRNSDKKPRNLEQRGEERIFEEVQHHPRSIKDDYRERQSPRNWLPTSPQHGYIGSPPPENNRYRGHFDERENSWEKASFKDREYKLRARESIPHYGKHYRKGYSPEHEKKISRYEDERHRYKKYVSPRYDAHRHHAGHYSDRRRRDYDHGAFPDGHPHRYSPGHGKRRASPRSPLHHKIVSERRKSPHQHFDRHLPHSRHSPPPRMHHPDRYRRRERSPHYYRHRGEQPDGHTYGRNESRRDTRADRREPEYIERRPRDSDGEEMPPTKEYSSAQEKSPVYRSHSSSTESTKMTLDQRLREMTGEAADDILIKNENEFDIPGKSPERSRSSSVDMEISEGDSDEERKHVGMNHHNIDHSKEIKTNFQLEMQQQSEHMQWNSFNNRVDMPPHGMWHMPDMMYPPNDIHHQNLSEGLPRKRQWIDYEENNGEADHYKKLMDNHMLGRNVLDNLVHDLTNIVNRDLNRKVIESVAFKVYEAWWDDESKRLTSNKIPLITSTNENKDVFAIKSENTIDSKPNELPSYNKTGTTKQLNTFDPLNWAKNSFAMDGFRIGMGLRSAISKMPSFRVKKEETVETPPPQEPVSSKEKMDKRRRNKENAEPSERKRSKKTEKSKKYKHKSILDSEGEDEDNESDIESDISYEDDKNNAVLDVDDIFSRSSADSMKSSSDNEDQESQKDEEESSDSSSHSEDETTTKEEQEFEKRKRKADVTEDEEEEELPKKVCKSEKDDDLSQASDNAAHSRPLAASLMSPTAPEVRGDVFTAQQLRHVHPKKRHRLISHDNSSYNAEQPSDRLSSDVDLPSIATKEREALEALMDINATQDTRQSSDSHDNDSHLSRPISAECKNRLEDEGRSVDSTKLSSPPSPPDQELKAVEALLSIKKSVPQAQRKTSNLKNQRKNKIPIQKTNETENDNRLFFDLYGTVSNENKQRMANLAEEHNYFAPTYGPANLYPELDPLVSQILEEHNYSRPILAPYYRAHIEKLKELASPTSTLSASSTYRIENDLTSSNERMSAAELVKFRREWKQKEDDHKAAKQSKTKLFREKPKFRPRNHLDEMRVAYDMWNKGLDSEDMMYIRETFEDYQNANLSWARPLRWAPHPVTFTPEIVPSRSQKRSKSKHKEKDELEHKFGCARTAGYFLLEAKAKLSQRRAMYGQDDTEKPSEARSKKCPKKEVTGSGDPCKNLGSRETRHFMRRIASEVGSDAGDLFKYNQLMFRKKAVMFARSSIHGWGLFAQEPIAADEMVIEYVGQVVRSLIAERREVHYTALGIGSSYLFRIDSDHIIDATKSGNYARFMNHSCNPSCYAKVITVDTSKKIVIYSKIPIKKGDEITYDYKFPLEDDKVGCFCGAENCRGTLN